MHVLVHQKPFGTYRTVHYSLGLNDVLAITQKDTQCSVYEYSYSGSSTLHKLMFLAVPDCMFSDVGWAGLGCAPCLSTPLRRPIHHVSPSSPSCSFKSPTRERRRRRRGDYQNHLSSAPSERTYARTVRTSKKEDKGYRKRALSKVEQQGEMGETRT